MLGSQWSIILGYRRLSVKSKQLIVSWSLNSLVRTCNSRLEERKDVSTHVRTNFLVLMMHQRFPLHYEREELEAEEISCIKELLPLINEILVFTRQIVAESRL